MERKTKVKRKTKETDITLYLNLDGNGDADISTGIPFFDHVLGSFAKHGQVDLNLRAEGDIEVGSHHLIEDVGICLGKAIKDCIAGKEGIKRFSFIILPMDDAEVCLSIDLGGRPYLRFNVNLVCEELDGMETPLLEDFFRAVVSNGFFNLHISKNVGLNSHHIIEAIMKAFGIILFDASRIIGRGIPSTKGTI
ncbi:MAG: imidazoleglycerol-phosphate dehydratase HisB [Candidatus Humimicrobiaceae bacterium]